MEAKNQKKDAGAAHCQTDKNWLKRISSLKMEIFLSLVLALIILLALLTHKPGRYKPIHLENAAEVSPYLTYKLADLFNNAQLDKPFNMLIEQKGLNDIVARGQWPVVFKPVTISAPSAVFAPKQIYLMATVQLSGLPTVATVKAEPLIDKNGLIVFNVQSVMLGSVPVTTLARNIARKITDYQLKDFDPDSWERRLWRGLLDNEPVEPTFKIYHDTVRITKVTIENEKLTLLMEPVPEED
ncbi:MAG: hypothetical protein JW912_07125 [Sedimentisphaerales bacterium]|nr:hypothetical protein [Sedimentisphaerales bacterium]